MGRKESCSAILGRILPVSGGVSDSCSVKLFPPHVLLVEY